MVVKNWNVTSFVTTKFFSKSSLLARLGLSQKNIYLTFKTDLLFHNYAKKSFNIRPWSSMPKINFFSWLTAGGYFFLADSWRIFLDNSYRIYFLPNYIGSNGLIWLIKLKSWVQVEQSQLTFKSSWTGQKLRQCIYIGSIWVKLSQLKSSNQYHYWPFLHHSFFMWKHMTKFKIVF